MVQSRVSISLSLALSAANNNSNKLYLLRKPLSLNEVEKYLSIRNSEQEKERPWLSVHRCETLTNGNDTIRSPQQVSMIGGETCIAFMGTFIWGADIDLPVNISSSVRCVTVSLHAIAHTCKRQSSNPVQFSFCFNVPFILSTIPWPWGRYAAHKCCLILSRFL